MSSNVSSVFIKEGSKVAPDVSVVDAEDGKSTRLKRLKRTTSGATESATTVFEGVTPLFLFASFMIGISICTYGLQKVIAFKQMQEGVEVNLVV